MLLHGTAATPGAVGRMIDVKRWYSWDVCGAHVASTTLCLICVSTTSQLCKTPNILSMIVFRNVLNVYHRHLTLPVQQ
jgi:hypothetical protein